MHDLIKDVFLKHLGNQYLRKMTDAAVLNFGNRKLAFTTDSFVVKPLFFPGGDIGKLAVCGTVNDLVVMGARPLFISCAMIIEEGFSIEVLEKITRSLSEEAKNAGVSVVTGDVKVVEKGSCDGIFINTAGVGEQAIDININNIRPGDAVIINGPIGQHGIAILAARNQLELAVRVKSDCASLPSLITPLLKYRQGIKFMRDPTRGGLATTLNEIAQTRNCAIMIDEESIPVSPAIKSSCEILGLDPLYLPNEGRVVLIVDNQAADKILHKMRRHPLGKGAQIIGRIEKNPPQRVYLKTISGGRRIVDMLVSDALPRIC